MLENIPKNLLYNHSSSEKTVTEHKIFYELNHSQREDCTKIAVHRR